MPLSTAVSALTASPSLAWPRPSLSWLPGGAAVALACASRLRRMLAARRARIVGAEAREAGLRESVSHQARMVAAVTHDLRQPLAAASAHVGVLRARLEAGQLRAAQEQSERVGEALEGLGLALEHLLLAARCDAGVDKPCLVDADLAPVLKRVRDDHAALAAAAGLRLVLSLPATPLPVRTDPTAMGRVLDNLVSNAVRYAGEGNRGGRPGVVLLRGCHLGFECRIDVADEGPGIPPARQAAIWEPCVRFGTGGPERGADDGRSLGLGLYLVRRLLMQLDGHRIALHSRPGRGTRFTLHLPSSAPPG
jgi:two-component system, sensor histidine kinase